LGDGAAWVRPHLVLVSRPEQQPLVSARRGAAAAELAAVGRRSSVGRARGVGVCRFCSGLESPLSSPRIPAFARRGAGTNSPQPGDGGGPGITETLVVMGPACAHIR